MSTLFHVDMLAFFYFIVILGCAKNDRIVQSKIWNKFFLVQLMLKNHNTMYYVPISIDLKIN